MVDPESVLLPIGFGGVVDCPGGSFDQGIPWKHHDFG